MSLPVGINLKQFSTVIRKALSIFRSRKVGNDSVNVMLPKKFVLTVEDVGTHIAVKFEPKLSTNIPGPIDPDIIGLRIFETYTLADLRVSNIRIEH